MSATTAVNPVVPPAPARPAAGPAAGADEGRFDRHLDAARQPRGQAHGESAREHEGEPAPAKAPDAAPTENPPAVQAVARDEGDPDAAALAAAMLALIGQAAPARPLASATEAMQAPAKAVDGARAATAPAAWVLLAGTAATVAKPGAGMDTDALALVTGLAKPAEQKDTLLDAAQPALAAGLPTAASTGAPGHAAVPVHQLDIASPAGTPAFAQELGQQVVWLGTQDVKQARIRLHPEDLGALDVKVSLHHDRVDVSFAVQHPAAVHAVQQTLPQLDALLAQHGLALGQADVGQRQQQGESARGGEGVEAVGGVEGESSGTPMAVRETALGLLDTFA